MANIDFYKQITPSNDTTLYGHNGADEAGFPRDPGNFKLSTIMSQFISAEDSEIQSHFEFVEGLDRNYTLNYKGVAVASLRLPPDRFLKEARFNQETKILTLTFATEGADNVVDIDFSSLIDVYSAGNGIQLQDATFSMKLQAGEARLKVSSAGLSLDLSDITTSIEEEAQTRGNADRELSVRIKSLEDSWLTFDSDLQKAKQDIADTNSVVNQMKSTLNKEAYIEWGGKNFSGSYGAIDACLVPLLGANRLAFAKPAGISIEYTRDSGATWTDYGASDAAKTLLFTDKGFDFIIGKADSTNKATPDYLLRITMDTSTANVYTQLHKFVLFVNTNGSSGCYCTIEKALQATPTTFVTIVNKASISGWSGYNVLNVPAFVTYGNDPPKQYGKVRFTFGCTSNTSNYSGLTIRSILGFGGVGWITPSTMAKTGRLYDYDGNKDVIFPARIRANGGTIVSLEGHNHDDKYYTKTEMDTRYVNVDEVYAGTGGIPRVKSDGVLEVGQIIDFHASNNYSIDYNPRLMAESDGSLTCSNVFRATKVWGAVAN